MINSDENILKVLEQSNEYFKSNNEMSSRIEENLWIFRSLKDLEPATPEDLLLGYRFPLIETNSEFESSIALCKFGFYKHAFIALRSVLELGILSAYWNADEGNHLDIRKWLVSLEDTPSRKTVFTKLKKNQNFLKFDNKHRCFSEGDDLFRQLSNFVHTKGHRHSSVDLGNANFNRFKEESLLKWLDLMTRVTKFVVILHILKYPVALQHTPIEQKFGINGPAGGFFEPYQTERIKQFLGKDVIITLQEISNNDPTAISRAKWVNEQPDITYEELQIQMGEI
ncbi:MAG: hypothetical protein WAN47_08530 [Nitrosotalea sp.]